MTCTGVPVECGRGGCYEHVRFVQYDTEQLVARSGHVEGGRNGAQFAHNRIAFLVTNQNWFGLLWTTSDIGQLEEIILANSVYAEAPEMSTRKGPARF